MLLPAGRGESERLTRLVSHKPGMQPLRAGWGLGLMEAAKNMESHTHQSPAWEAGPQLIQIKAGSGEVFKRDLTSISRKAVQRHDTSALLSFNPLCFLPSLIAFPSPEASHNKAGTHACLGGPPQSSSSG